MTVSNGVSPSPKGGAARPPLNLPLICVKRVANFNAIGYACGVHILAGKIVRNADHIAFFNTLTNGTQFPCVPVMGTAFARVPWK